MRKKLTRQGNSAALVIDKPVVDLLGMSAGSMVEVKTDGRSLLVSPIAPQTLERRRAFLDAMDEVEKAAGRMLKRLAKR